MPLKYIRKILEAKIYDLVDETPLDRAPTLSARCNNTLLLKREDLQPVFSFKIRGAHNKINHLNQDQRERGVIASSAGNHAQGVAMSCKKLGIRATIVMPTTTPAIKVEAVKRLNAHVVLFGDRYDDAYAHARMLSEAQNLTFVHPYDDPEVIAGQGTIGMEILRQCPNDIHAIFIPVGGGGLVAGIGAYVKYLRPETRIIGVEPEGSPTLYRAMCDKKRTVLKDVDIFADGVAVKQIGEETYRLAKECVDEVILVSTDEICAAIKDIFNDTRSIAEPAGALSVAGMKKYIEREGIDSHTMVAVVSGANVNFDRLRDITERAELGEDREGIIAVCLPERPGSLKAFCQILGPRSITEFNYRYSNSENAYVYLGVQTNRKERMVLLEQLRENQYWVADLTDNELAKDHIRHMVGGLSLVPVDEYLYRFQFPERPGALMNFLTKMADTWNISLFHYRNLGSIYGNVLVGFQIPATDRKSFKAFLSEVGYTCVDETKNEAYQLFLRSSK